LGVGVGVGVPGGISLRRGWWCVAGLGGVFIWRSQMDVWNVGPRRNKVDRRCAFFFHALRRKKGPPIRGKGRGRGRGRGKSKAKSGNKRKQPHKRRVLAPGSFLVVPKTKTKTKTQTDQPSLAGFTPTVLDSLDFS
jgi:hypothetical protein